MIQKISLKTVLQYLLPKRILSQLAAKAADCRWRLVKNLLIDCFSKFYKIDLNEAIETNPHNYATFNDFFARQLKTNARTIACEPNTVISPVDGKIMQIGKCSNTQLISAKNSNFTISQLIGNQQDANAFENGTFAVLYLSPNNYHRVHMPITGKLRKARYIPGNLFSVNPEVVAHIPNILARNERLVSLFETAIGEMAVIMVGAMIVGGIEAAWSGTIAPNKSNALTTINYDAYDITYKYGEEIGHFKLGSTVILLFPKNTVQWRADLEVNSPIQMGNKLGMIV